MTSLQKLTTAIEIYNFKTQQLRVVGTIEEPWFAAKDICDILGLSNTHQSLLNIPDKWKGVCKVSTLKGDQDMSIVNESGLYKMILRSNKPEAQPFQEWVCEQVLPSIRKKGEYVLEEYKKKLEEQQKALEEKTKEVETLTKRYVKKKVTVDGVNVVYLMTSEEGEKERLYAVGKSKILKSRVQGYNGNKIHDFKVVYHKSFKSVQIMTLAEKCVLLKLDEYKDKANHDVFKLQDGKDISLFTKILDDTSKFFENVSENVVLPTKSEEKIKKKEIREKAKEYRKSKTYIQKNKERIKLRQYDYFQKNKRVIGIKRKLFYQDNKTKILAINKSYRGKNKEKISAINKSYREKNKERLSSYKKKYYRENLAEFKKILAKYRAEHKEQRVIYDKQYRKKNKEKIASRKKEYYQKNKDKFAKNHAKYYQDNKDHLASYNASYYSEKKDKIIEKSKKYTEAHKEDLIIKRKELCVCECGMEITKLNMPRHILSKIHIQKMNLTCSAMTICSCGAEVTKAGIYKHKNTDKHKNRIKNLSSIQ